MRLQRKSTIAYMFRNFWQLVYVVLPVSALLAIFYNPATEVSLYISLFKGEVALDNYLQLLTDNLTVLRLGKYWWVTLIAIVLLVLTMCLLVVKISKHMRVGKMPALPFKQAFGIFPQMLLYVVACIAVNEVGMLIVVGVSFLIRFIGDATAIVSITLVLTFVMRVFLAYMFGLLLVTFPLRYSENYRFNVAMSYSARIMSVNRGKLVGLSMLYVCSRLLVATIGYFLQPYGPHLLVYAIAFIMLLMYVPSFAFKKFYDDVGGERRDLIRKIFD